MTVNEVIAAVCEARGVTLGQLLGPSRLRSIAISRQIACWLLRELTPMSLPEVGYALHRDHTTVLHAVRKVEGDPLLLEAATAIAWRLQDVRRAA